MKDIHDNAGANHVWPEPGWPSRSFRHQGGPGLRFIACIMYLVAWIEYGDSAVMTHPYPAGLILKQ
ncbi:MAG: hypothetical protein ABFS37_13845 [Acidobacteriota bacterium]